MKRINISTEEKKTILESHNKLRDFLMGHHFDKNLVSEQAPQNPTGSSLLTSAQQNCGKLKTAKMAKKKNALGQDTDALFIKATADVPNPIRSGDFTVKTGDNVYYFADMTWESYEPNQSGEKLRGSGTWACKALNVEQADIDKRIAALKAKGWKTYDELTDGDKQVIRTNPNLFSKVVIGNKELYLSKSAGTPELGSTQITYLDQYTGGKMGVDYATEKQRSDEPSKYGNWIKVVVPKGNVFAEDVIIYRNPASERVAERIQQRKQQTTTQQITERDCIDFIESWYDDFKKGTSVFEVQSVEKIDVQKCSRYYSMGVYDYNRNTRNILKALGGFPQGPDYPAVPQYGDEAQYRIPFKERTAKS